MNSDMLTAEWILLLDIIPFCEAFGDFNCCKLNRNIRRRAWSNILPLKPGVVCCFYLHGDDRSADKQPPPRTDGSLFSVDFLSIKEYVTVMAANPAVTKEWIC